MADKTIKSPLLKKPVVVQKEAPAGIKALAILYYINAAMMVIFTIFIIILATFIIAYLPAFESEIISSAELSGASGAEIIPLLTSGFIIFFAAILILIFLGSAIIDVIIGRGLWKLRKWARILVLVFTGIGALSSLAILPAYAWAGRFISIGMTLVSMAVNLLIFLYLLLNKEVKEAFS
jgi:hypothetical protein